MIKYDVYKTPSPKRTEGDMFHARAVNSEVVSFDKLKEDISYASSATPADVSHIIENVISQIEHHLSCGRSVQVGDLGTFSVGISGPSTNNKKAINANSLKVNDVYFRPKKKLICNINGQAKFESVAIKHHSASCSNKEIEALLTDYFKNHSNITRHEMESLCGLTRITANRRLVELTSGAHPLLRREGPLNGAYYVPVKE
jgi:predicted histone-like DNA-binding protein